ncbi:right-handed parallel beta-helix repeat-containing protein, partial [Methanobacterium sp.]|uniref:right-handed parallel beta-helix repeat-containing protein n=1 Tax=Methanobacterium sp. TaxID=2164 RepID=UPI003C7507EB
MISTKKINANLIIISLILISLTAIFTFMDNVSAAQTGNISSQDNLSSSNFQSVNSQSTVKTVQNTSIKNTSKSNQSSTSFKSKNNQKLQDPQIWRDGTPIARGGQPAGYNWGTIQAAINAAQNGDTIMLENGATFSGNGNTQITISKNLIFDVLGGGTATIDGSGNRWGFIISQGYTVTFNDITFQNFYRSANGGAIQNGGTLTLNKCDFTSNTANNGGAVYSTGTLTVTNCDFTGNSATGSGQNNGGAIFSSGTLTATGSSFVNNDADSNGGAIYTDDAEIHFNRIMGNTPTGSQIRRSGGTVNAQNNWWGSNTTPYGKVSNGPVVTTWLVLRVTASPDTILTSGTSTVTADLTHNNAGTYFDPASGHVPDGTPVTFTLSPSTIGSLSLLSGTTTDGSLSTTFTGNSNPGTATVSATIDGVVQSATITVARTHVYVSPTGSDTTGDGSQSNPYQTISKGISMVYPGGTVHILSGTYTGANNRDITISKNVNITGEGGTVTINAQNASNIFTINSGCTVTMSNLILANGTGTNGGAISNAGTLTVNNCTFIGNSGSYGGAIWTTGTLNVNNCTFRDNTANTDGGGISNGNGSTIPTGIVTVTNSTFTGNTANYGGALWNHSTLIVNGCTFTSNSANYGGAIRNWGTLMVTGSNFTGNTGTTNADAISNYQGNAEIHFSRFIGNGDNDINAEYNAAGSTVDAENNWWGSNSGPSSGRVTAAAGATVDANPWLILTINANPNSIRRNGTSTVTAYITRNSNGIDTSSLGYLPDGITITFGNDSLGTVNPITGTTVNSQSNTIFTAKNTPGLARVSATVDGVTVYTTIIIGNTGNFIINNTIAYDDSIIYLHDTGLFHIIVHNNGPDGATGVKVTLIIPEGLQLIAVNPIVGSYDSLTNTWTIGNISNNGTANLDLLLKAVQSGTSLTVTANVTGNEEGTDAVASKTVNIRRAADLQVTQTVNNSTPNQGSSITSTITVKNNGPDSANNISIYYKPPAGLNIVSITHSVGSYNSATGLWTISSLAWNGSATLTITATVTATSGTIIKNTVKVSREDE